MLRERQQHRQDIDYRWSVTTVIVKYQNIAQIIFYDVLTSSQNKKQHASIVHHYSTVKYAGRAYFIISVHIMLIKLDVILIHTLSFMGHS